jgi:SARP family transcriptional regulator, regulator of embCAB operon
VTPAELEGRSALRLVLPSDAWVDLEAAAEGIHRAEAAVARGDWTGAWGPARVAQHVALRGFLAGEDAPWVHVVRQRVGELYARSLELAGLASLGIGGGELATAERAARSLVACEPLPGERVPDPDAGARAPRQHR